MWIELRKLSPQVLTVRQRLGLPVVIGVFIVALLGVSLLAANWWILAASGIVGMLALTGWGDSFCVLDKTQKTAACVYRSWWRKHIYLRSLQDIATIQLDTHFLERLSWGKISLEFVTQERLVLTPYPVLNSYLTWDKAEDIRVFLGLELPPVEYAPRLR